MFSEKILVPQNIELLNSYVAGKSIAEVQKLYGLERISKLASNENRSGCSPHVKSAILKILNEIQDYPDPVSRKLRSKIAELNDVEPENIILAAGSESIISILCRTFFLNHENAVTADATFVGFFVQTGIRGIKLKKVPVTDDFRFDVAGLLDAIDQETKMVYIANPNNPTGTYINKNEYRHLIEQLPDDVLLIVDEAYFEYAREVEDYPHALDNRKENVIVLRTFSKAYGLAGLRIGYGIADQYLIDQMMKTKLTFEPCATAQAAAIAAIGDQNFLEESVQLVEKGKEQLYQFFDHYGVKYVRSIANSVLMVLKNENEAIEFTQKMLEEGVILRRTEAFGLRHGVRITIGLDEEMNHFEESFKKIWIAE